MGPPDLQALRAPRSSPTLRPRGVGSGGRAAGAGTRRSPEPGARRPEAGARSPERCCAAPARGRIRPRGACSPGRGRKASLLSQTRQRSICCAPSFNFNSRHRFRSGRGFKPPLSEPKPPAQRRRGGPVRSGARSPLPPGSEHLENQVSGGPAVPFRPATAPRLAWCPKWTPGYLF